MSCLVDFRSTMFYKMGAWVVASLVFLLPTMTVGQRRVPAPSRGCPAP